MGRTDEFINKIKPSKTIIRPKMRNRLHHIFEEMGFDKISPSDKLLGQLKMSRKRFFQLVNGTTNSEMTVSEKLKLEAWLHGVQKTDFRLFNEAGQLKIEN